LGFEITRRFWIYIDVILITLSTWVSMILIIPESLDPINIRVVESILVVLICFKGLYFLSLIGEIAPLVDIIFVIIQDIKYFMLIYVIAVLALVCSFFLIGRNQEYYAKLNLEGLPEEEVISLIPSYSRFRGAFIHVMQGSFGNFETDLYFDNPMSNYCVILYLCLTFFLCVHLLNMLIAIMGETFKNNSQVAEAKRRISQLAFVVDNWWIYDIPNREKIVYIVSAQPIDDSDKTG
jgi:hypothetical protein